ncbi:MAG: (Fe-S)-binding protein [Rhizomicrobium sp.]
MARPRVGLFVTCLVDLVRPQIGFAAVKLLEQSGCDVVVPQMQTCCGQPVWNAGADKDARAIAEQSSPRSADSTMSSRHRLLCRDDQAALSGSAEQRSARAGAGSEDV